MTSLIDIQVKDQTNKIVTAKALVRKALLESQPTHFTLNQCIEHIIVDDEIILPSIELLYESKHSNKIYKVI